MKKLLQQKTRRTPTSKLQTYAQLRKLWYNKLAESGFKDIESDIGGVNRLKHWDSHWFQSRWTEVEFSAKEKYYIDARQLLNTFDFETKRDKIVWYWHSEGKSCRETQELTGVNKDIVNKIVRTIRRCAWNME